MRRGRVNSPSLGVFNESKQLSERPAVIAARAADPRGGTHRGSSQPSLLSQTLLAVAAIGKPSPREAAGPSWGANHPLYPWQGCSDCAMDR